MSESDDSDSSSTVAAAEAVKSLNERKKDNALKLYYTTARWIPLGIDPFINIYDVLHYGMKARSYKEHERAAMDDAEQYKCLVFEKITALVPGFLSLLSKFNEGEPTKFLRFTKEMNKQMSNTKSFDYSRIKDKVADYIPPDETTRVQYILPDCKSREKWGWNHSITARLMCPMRLVNEFDKNPEDFRAKVQRNTIQITAEDFPVCLYDESKYDTTLADPQLGLLRSPLLLKVYRHIFTGPSSAQKGKATGGKTSRGLANHLDSPTPQTIAYAAIMLRAALSSLPKWNNNDDLFGFEDFYYNMLDMMDVTMRFPEEEDRDGLITPWVEDTLNWWTINVPGLKKRKTTVTPKVIKNGQSDIAKMKAARRRRNLNCPIDPQLEGSSSAQSSATSLSPPTSTVSQAQVSRSGISAFGMAQTHPASTQAQPHNPTSQMHPPPATRPQQTTTPATQAPQPPMLPSELTTQAPQPPSEPTPQAQPPALPSEPAPQAQPPAPPSEPAAVQVSKRPIPRATGGKQGTSTPQADTIESPLTTPGASPKPKRRKKGSKAAPDAEGTRRCTRARTKKPSSRK